ncbi:MAG: TIM barrel protein [Rhodobacteraceae bacterium]|nr:TIM barrel protein [Paracoccaceae bacterium]
MTDFSYQLYSSRMFPPLTDTLHMLADLGYAQVEGYGALYADASSLGMLEAGLKDTGLTMPTGHFSFDMCKGEPDRVLEIARALGVKAVIVPYILPDQRPTDAAGWAAYAKGLAEVGKRYRDAGLRFGYHNHDFEFRPTADGALPIDLILAADDHIGLEFDVAWAVRAGADPMATIAKYGPRLMAAHLKDIAPQGECVDEDGWADLGYGTIGWATILPALRKAGCTWFVMEHDKPSDPHRFASRAIAAARKL